MYNLTGMAKDVAQVVTAVINCADLLETQRLVEEERDTLFSAEADAYFRLLLDSYTNDADVTRVISLKQKLISQSRQIGIPGAFAVQFLEMFPDKLSDESATEIRRLIQEGMAQSAIERRPEVLPQLQRVVVGSQLLQGLIAALQNAPEAQQSRLRVSLCRIAIRLADARIDPDTWAATAGELANALAREVELDEAISLLREVLAYYRRAGNRELEASSLHNLGNVLATRAQGENNRDIIEGLGYLAAAEELRPRETVPGAWAQTQIGMGQALLRWQGTGRSAMIDRAIQHIVAAIETYAAGDAAEERLATVQELLDQAYLARCTEAGESLSTSEQFEMHFDDRVWKVADRVVTTRLTLTEWIPASTSLLLWSELVTTISRWQAQTTPWASYLAATRRRLASNVTCGDFRWKVLGTSARELMYAWSVQCDLLRGEQFEVVRVVRGDTGLHSIHFAAQGVMSDEQFEFWCRRLAEIRLVPSGIQPLVEKPLPASREEVFEIIDRLQQPADGVSILDPVDFYAQCIERVDQSTESAVWASISALAGMRLIASAERSSACCEVAIRALRRSLEFFSRDGQPEMWARAVLNLARLFLIRQTGHRERNLKQSAWGYGEVIRVFTGLHLAPELASGQHGLGTVCRQLASREDPALTRVAVDLYQSALQTRTMEAYPEEWAETTLALGDTFCELRMTADAEHSYSLVLEQVTANPRFQSVDTDITTELMARAITGLNQIDREGIPEPSMPPGYKDRATRGNALYLRPLLSAGALVFPNQFRDPEKFAVRFDREPEWVSLESALYRSLGEQLLMMTLGGRAEGMGASRFYVVGGSGWQALIEREIEECDLVLLVPHDSPGVRWEIERLLKWGALPKCLFVIPPLSPRFDVRALWAEARNMMLEYALNVPEYVEKGMFFRLTSAGLTIETFPFEAVWDNSLFGLIQHLLPQ